MIKMQLYLYHSATLAESADSHYSNWRFPHNKEHLNAVKVMRSVKKERTNRLVTKPFSGD